MDLAHLVFLIKIFMEMDCDDSKQKNKDDVKLHSRGNRFIMENPYNTPFAGVFFACVILSLWITYVKGQCDVAFALGITILAVLQWLALSFFIWLRMRWGRKRQMDLFKKFLTKDAKNL